MNENNKDIDITKLIINFIGGIISPFCLIWSLNQLFQLNINYSFYNWVSGLLLLIFIRSPNNNNYNNY